MRSTSSQGVEAEPYEEPWMRVRLVTAGVCLLLTLVICAPIALAGGGRWDFGLAYVPGARVTDTQPVALKLDNPRLGRLDDAPFFAYLISSTEDVYHIPLPDDALPLGEVHVEARDGRFGTATIDFIVPDVQPGEYFVTVCNEPCRKPLGDMLGTAITIVASDLEARLTARLERLEMKVFNLRSEMDALARRRLGQTLSRLRIDLTTRTDAFTARMEDLEARVHKLERGHASSESDSSRSGLALGALTLISIAWFALKRRGGRNRPG
jgi:hypothetical protein